MERLRSAAAARAAALEKSAFRTRRSITSMGEARGTLDLDGTSGRGVGSTGSIPAEVRVAH